MPRGTLSTCLSDTPILGGGHVLLYPLDTVPTKVPPKVSPKPPIKAVSMDAPRAVPMVVSYNFTTIQPSSVPTSDIVVSF